MSALPFSKKLQPISSVLKSPAFIILVICLILLSFNLISTYRLRPFNSDDVFWQAILLHWQPFDGTTATLGNASIHVDKLPLFDFFNHFFQPSRKILLVEAVITTLLGFAGFYLASLYFLKKAGAKLSYLTLLPFVWLSSFGYSFIQLYLNTNWRGFQLGVSFIAFALVAAIWYGDIKLKKGWSKLWTVVIAAYAGLQIYSDPYFLYFTIAPLVLLAIILLIARKINSRQLLTVGAPIVLSLVFSKLFGLLFYAAGVRTTIEYPMEFAHFENLADGFSGSIHSILIIFGADFFGLPLKTFGTLVPLINFILLGFIVYAIISFILKLRSHWQSLSFDKIWLLFFMGVSVLVFLSHSMSTAGQGTFTYRYFLLLALLFTLIFTLVLHALKPSSKKYLLGGLLVLAVILNLSLTAFSGQDAKRPDVAVNRANTVNDLVIRLLKDRGYTKGYANYWDANISTYLAGGHVSFLPSVCNDHRALKWHWLINDSGFDTKATKSFYYLNPDVPAACQHNDIPAQFGEAHETISIGNKTLFLYDHDITPLLGTANN